MSNSIRYTIRMSKAARAIIIKDGNILVMHRNKRGKQYYTLVGGQCKEGEDLEVALRREIKEETDLDITSSRLVFVEKHPEPYNEQYIFLCDIDAHQEVALQKNSEEAMLAIIDSDSHKPVWVDADEFARLSFFTLEVQQAILESLQNGFPTEPVIIN